MRTVFEDTQVSSDGSVWVRGRIAVSAAGNYIWQAFREASVECVSGVERDRGTAAERLAAAMQVSSRELFA